MTIKIIDENTLEQDGVIFVFKEIEDYADEGECCALCYVQPGKANVVGVCLAAPCAASIREDNREGYFVKK